jgi:hypothetical protein
MEGFIESLNQELAQRVATKPIENHSLMPVIQMPSLSRNESKRAPETKRRVR